MAARGYSTESLWENCDYSEKNLSIDASKLKFKETFFIDPSKFSYFAKFENIQKTYNKQLALCKGNVSKMFDLLPTFFSYDDQKAEYCRRFSSDNIITNLKIGKEKTDSMLPKYLDTSHD